MTSYCAGDACTNSGPTYLLSFYEAGIRVWLCEECYTSAGYFAGLIEEGNADVHHDGDRLGLEELEFAERGELA